MSQIISFGGGGGGSTTEFKDNEFRILDDIDNTKELSFEVSGVITGTTRTITMCDADLDLTSPSFGGSVTAATGMTITTGNLNLPATTSTAGQITINSINALQMYGTRTFFAGGAGNLTLSGADDNIGIGSTALDSLTSGDNNVAIGTNAGSAITTGSKNVFIGTDAGVACHRSANVAIGWEALKSFNNVTIGEQNVAIGLSAMANCTTGISNVAIGSSALLGITNTAARENISIGTHTLRNLTSGKYNIAIGSVSTSGFPYGTGGNYTGSESDNILFSNYGTVGDQNTIRIGTQGTGNGQQDKAFISGIYNTTPSGGNDGTVIIDSNGQLGSTDKVTGVLSINSQTGTTYTTVLSDVNSFITMTNASASTLTIPPFSSVAYPIGAVIYVQQLGAGQVTLVPGAGVTFKSADDAYKLVKQNSGCSLIQTLQDQWSIFGDLEA